MKHILLALLCLLALPASAQTLTNFDPCAADARAHYTPIAQNQTRALLFRIVQCGKADSYLFGTMHSDSLAVRQRAAKAFALVKGRLFAGFEFIAPADAVEITKRAMFDPLPYANLQRHLSAKEWKKLVIELSERRRMPLAKVRRMRPWAAAVLLQVPASTRGEPILDDALKEEATKAGTMLKGVETIEEQFSIFESMSEAEQWAMLHNTLESLTEVNAMNEALREAYLRQDLHAIAELGEKGFRDITDPKLRDYLRETLLTRRNARMAERMDSGLRQGNGFFAVGALHLTGDGGLLQRLEQLGYFILPLP